MKSLIVFLLIVFLAISVYPQQFNSLDGIEDEQGNTQLLYRFGEQFYIYNPVYKFNTNTLQESLLIQAYYYNFPGGDLAKAVLDFEFFPGDENNFMNVGSEINPDNHSYIARNDTIVFGGIEGRTKVDISKQDAQKVFVFGGGGPVRSWDGGHTFPLDSIPAVTNFIPIALSDFDDEVMFGFDEDSKFSKNTIVVDTSFVAFDEYFKIFFDANQFHIYRVNYTYGGYSLNVSNNKGNAFTWTKTYQSENPIFVTIDSTESGVVYLADGRRIYKSTNNGYNFYPYKTLPRRLVGLYNKPNSDIIYAASKYQLYEVRPDTTIIIKSVPIPYWELASYPLKTGNKWIYLETIADFNGFPYTYSYEFNVREILKDTLLSNGKIYFKVYDNTTLNFENIFYERVDSATGFVYRFDEMGSSGYEEYLIDDLLVEVGDTILSSRDIKPNGYFMNNICIEKGLYDFFGQIRIKKSFRKEDLTGYSYNLINDVGLDSIYHSWDFGFSISKLKGCIINGVVYGDTTLTDVNDGQNPIPAEFILEQNYPNPFNPSTKIRWQSPNGSWQTLKVFDVLGKEVATLVDEYRNAGSYEVEFNASQFPSGVYFYQLNAGDFVQTRKMILLK